MYDVFVVPPIYMINYSNVDIECSKLVKFHVDSSCVVYGDK